MKGGIGRVRYKEGGARLSWRSRKMRLRPPLREGMVGEANVR